MNSARCRPKRAGFAPPRAAAGGSRVAAARVRAPLSPRARRAPAASGGGGRWPGSGQPVEACGAPADRQARRRRGRRSGAARRRVAGAHRHPPRRADRPRRRVRTRGRRAGRLGPLRCRATRRPGALRCVRSSRVFNRRPRAGTGACLPRSPPSAARHAIPCSGGSARRSRRRRRVEAARVQALVLLSRASSMLTRPSVRFREGASRIPRLRRTVLRRGGLGFPAVLVQTRLNVALLPAEGRDARPPKACSSQLEP